MTVITASLDGFCAELARVYEQVNSNLSVISEQKGADAAEVFSYRLQPPAGTQEKYQAKYGLHSIPYSAFHRNHGYRLQEFDFSMPCYLTARKFGKQSQTVIILQAPSWWRKIRYPHILKHLEIHVAKDGAHLRLGPATALRPKRSHRQWILLLTEQQQSTFSSLMPGPPKWRSLLETWRETWFRKAR